MAGTPRSVQADNMAAARQAGRNLGAVLHAGGIGTEIGLRRAGAELVGVIRRVLSRPGAGRLYRRRNVAHRASVPGQPPAVDRGKLRASYAFEVGRDVAGPWLDVGTPNEAAPHLEFGTVHMEARPHLRPAFDLYRTRLTSAIAREIERNQRAAIARLKRGFFR